MVKDGDDSHRLEMTNLELEKLGYIFQVAQTATQSNIIVET